MSPADRQPHVAIVGSGYSGTLQAIALLDRGARVTLVERGPRFARGAAYGTAHPDHLLNVRASAMSAFPDRPDDFAEWLAREGAGGPDDFAQRRVYGRYLGGLLEEARSNAGARLQTLHDEVVAIDREGDREALRLANGGVLEADAVILAIGNLPPEPTRGIRPTELPAGVYVDNPWAADLSAGLSDDDTVLLVGTGLTAVDAAMMLESAGFGGRILALSRRGLLPRSHAEAPVAKPMPGRGLEPRGTALLRYVRREVEGDWRSRVDSLRPVTQALWHKAGLEERRRFLRHLRPWWDVHRHRIAPSIARRIAGLQQSGRLKIGAGRIVEAGQDGEAARVRWRPRGAEAEEVVTVRRIVNCTGPQADVSRAGDPLLDALLAAGRIRPDSLRIGIDVGDGDRIVDAQGRTSESLFAVGPMSKGAHWEIVAVPDIRQQVKAVASAIVTEAS